MGIFELILIAIGLAMDAFAVSICKGLAMCKMSFKKANICGIYFGLFQGGMPLLGYLLGYKFQQSIESIDHFIAFGLLTIIGGKMIYEAIKGEDDDISCDTSFKEMIILAIATSIDALAIGITFAFLNVNILFAVSLIAGITYILSVIGVKIGNIFGCKYKAKAEIFGGIVLIFIGLKILLEHLGII
ncbi:MAG: manganese efflux pump [Clostridiales bacterium]|nr:manganese efflux pump [Clostridiales bacterium]